MRDYITEFHGNRTAAVLACAADLMKGDPPRFQSGYDLTNALMAAADMLLPGPDGPLVVGSIGMAANRITNFAPEQEGI